MAITYASDAQITYSATSPLSASVAATAGQSIIVHVQDFDDSSTAHGTIASSGAFASDVWTCVYSSPSASLQWFLCNATSSGTRSFAWTAAGTPASGCLGNVSVWNPGSGLVLSFEASARNTGTGTNVTTSSITPGGAGRLYMAGLTPNDGSYNATTPKNSFTALAMDATENVASYRIYTGTTGLTTGWTISHSDTWEAVVVTFAATSPPSAPDAPTGVSAIPGDEKAVVLYTPGDDGGAPVTGYTATSDPGGATGTNADGGPIVVTGLTNGTGYTFTVVATNSVGDSSASSASASVTPATSGLVVNMARLEKTAQETVGNHSTPLLIELSTVGDNQGSAYDTSTTSELKVNTSGLIHLLMFTCGYTEGVSDPKSAGIALNGSTTNPFLCYDAKTVDTPKLHGSILTNTLNSGDYLRILTFYGGSTNHATNAVGKSWDALGGNAEGIETFLAAMVVTGDCAMITKTSDENLTTSGTAQTIELSTVAINQGSSFDTSTASRITANATMQVLVGFNAGVTAGTATPKFSYVTHNGDLTGASSNWLVYDDTGGLSITATPKMHSYATMQLTSGDYLQVAAGYTGSSGTNTIGKASTTGPESYLWVIRLDA